MDGDAAVRVRLTLRCTGAQAWQILQFLKGEGDIPPPPTTPLKQMKAWHLRRSMPLYETNAAFAEAMGINEDTLYRHRKVLKLPKPRSRREAIERQEIVALLGKNLTYKEIAARLGITPQTLYNRRMKYGL